MLENAYFCSRPLFSADDYDPFTEGQTDLFLASDQGSLAGLCMQDSPCAAITITSTYPDAHSHSILTSLRPYMHEKLVKNAFYE